MGTLPIHFRSPQLFQVGHPYQSRFLGPCLSYLIRSLGLGPRSCTLRSSPDDSHARSKQVLEKHCDREVDWKAGIRAAAGRQVPVQYEAHFWEQTALRHSEPPVDEGVQSNADRSLAEGGEKSNLSSGAGVPGHEQLCESIFFVLYTSSQETACPSSCCHHDPFPRENSV